LSAGFALPAHRTARAVPGLRRARAGAILLCLGLLASACTDDDSASINAALHGTVRDAQTGKRLAGVKVEFESDTLETLSDTTNSEGSYALNVDSDTPTGRLTASKSGYETGVVSVFLDDANVAVDIVLTRETTGS
jgi:hypothetical protein